MKYPNMLELVKVTCNYYQDGFCKRLGIPWFPNGNKVFKEFEEEAFYCCYQIDIENNKELLLQTIIFTLGTVDQGFMLRKVFTGTFYRT